MGKAQGAANAFLFCSLRQGEGEKIGRFLLKYIRFHLFFWKRGNNTTATPTTPVSAADPRSSYPPRFPARHFPLSQQSYLSPPPVPSWICLREKLPVQKGLSLGVSFLSCSLLSPVCSPVGACSKVGTSSRSVLQAPEGTPPGTSLRWAFLPQAMLLTRGNASPGLQAVGRRRWCNPTEEHGLTPPS